MPYLRFTSFRVRPGNRARLEQVIAEAGPAIRTQPGFRSAFFYISDDGGEGGAISVWETRIQAQTITTAVRDHAQRMLEDVLEEPPVTRIHEVYEPGR